ncbi:hypothetical protein ARMGADRAFT_1011315 [Armillaria gallica]|uniref:Uncharacterized protein n=1 Tax=Armillaria gallica TaxID=47427 RepID=A0A2H3DVK5_ARMGA|nr:hypothetical protein ARMGADRAFT_1011315 [Armillaria gallica]
MDALTEQFHYTSLTPFYKPHSPVQTTNHQHRLLNHVFDHGLRLSTLKDGPKYRKMSKLALCSQSRFKIVAWTTELASSYADQTILGTSLEQNLLDPQI